MPVNDEIDITYSDVHHPDAMAKVEIVTYSIATSRRLQTAMREQSAVAKT